MDVFFGGVAALGLLVVAVPLGLIILGLAIVFNGRREADPAGLRTTSVYFGLVNFIALLVLIVGATSIVSSLSSLIIDKDDRAVSQGSFEEFDSFSTDISPFDEGGFDSGFDSSFGSDADPNDKAIRDTIQAGLVVVPALLVFLFHWRRREEFVAAPEFADSPALRADRIYLYAICLVTALLGSIGAGRAIYDVFRLIIPGITSDLGDNSLERKQALSDMLTMLTLTLTSGYLFFWHWRLVSGETELWKRLRGPGGSQPAADLPPPDPGTAAGA